MSDTDVRLIVHDLERKLEAEVFPRDKTSRIISDTGRTKHCTGCFGCWIKNPGACVIEDHYETTGELMGRYTDMVIVSKCVYGGFSPFVKNIVDRSISYLHPYFEIRDGNMYHRRRYDNVIELKVYFYGESISARERETAERYVKALGEELQCTIKKIVFVERPEQLKGMIGCRQY